MIRDMYPGLISCVMCSRCKNAYELDPLIKSADQITFISLNRIFASKCRWIKSLLTQRMKALLSGELTMKTCVSHTYRFRSDVYTKAVRSQFFVWKRMSVYLNYRLSQASIHNNKMSCYNLKYILVKFRRSALTIYQFWNQYSLSQKTGLLLDAMCQRTIASTSQAAAKSIIL